MKVLVWSAVIGNIAFGACTLLLAATHRKLDAASSYHDVLAARGNALAPWQIPLAFPIYPDRPGLLPWGRNDVGNYMFWFTEGEPSRWPVVLAQGRSDRYERFDMGMRTFLEQALMQELDSTIWPDDFPEPNAPMVFQPSKLKKKRKTR